jgi:ceramide glucosyltransferase
VYAFFANFAGWASFACYALAALGCAYALFAAWAARGFVRYAPEPAGDYPPVTLLKPLHGMEPDLYANLAGFCAQAYPSPIQIIFGVDSPADPAVGIVRKLVADFPDRDLALVINARRYGENRKVSNLINMAREARHEVLIVSDSDIAVAPDYLQRVTAALAQPGVGLVTCLYRGVAAAGMWSRLGAAAIDYHFLPNVLVGLKLGFATPCFGSTIALRAKTLAEIGGFEAVADQLADDYALGELVRATGQTVAIPKYIVAHVCGEQSARDLIRHELRWARTIRSIDPAGFAGLAITYASPLALIGLALGGINAAGLIVVAALVCRYALQNEVDRVFHLRGEWFWLGPLRDLLSFAIFVASFFGRGVEWRGHRYGLRTDNKLAYYGEVET